MGKLIEGAKAAREASDGHLIVELVMTEIGVIVRGKYADARRAQMATTHEYGWEEIDAAPVNPLPNAVALVSGGLRS